MAFNAAALLALRIPAPEILPAFDTAALGEWLVCACGVVLGVAGWIQERGRMSIQQYKGTHHLHTRMDPRDFAVRDGGILVLGVVS